MLAVPEPVLYCPEQAYSCPHIATIAASLAVIQALDTLDHAGNLRD